MRLYHSLVLFFAAVPVTVSACEGGCIVGITNVFLGNYSSPVQRVLMTVVGIFCVAITYVYSRGTQASQISNLVPGDPGPDNALQYLQPVTNAYANTCYDGMETAIFPSYFHGKCIKDGVEPPGCPNPNCPVVCGTPGSLVHFYGKLRYIAFNQTRHILKELLTPGSDTYQQVEQGVLQANKKTRRSIRIYARQAYGTVPMLLTKREEDVKTRLRQTMANVPSWLEQICGGSGNGDTNDLPDCSWEDAMKQYILTFP